MRYCLNRLLWILIACKYKHLTVTVMCPCVSCLKALDRMLVRSVKQTNFIDVQFVTLPLIPVTFYCAHIHTLTVSCWIMTFISAATPRTDWQVKALPFKKDKQYSLWLHKDTHTHTGMYFLARIAWWKNKYWYLGIWLSVAIMNIKGNERGKLLTDTAVNSTVQANSRRQASPVRSYSCR